MIVPWFVVWLLCHTPPVHPWNDWFIALIVAIVLL